MSEAPAGRPAVFLDKDGTLLVDVPYNVDPAQVVFMPGALDALARLARAGFALVVVSNQSGLATGRFTAAAFEHLRAHVEHRMQAAGAALDGFVWCPHAPGPAGPACRCRKPEPGLLQHAAAALQIDLGASWMVGDILDDVEAGRRSGCRTVLFDSGGETEWRPAADGSDVRTPHHRCERWAAVADLILSQPAHPAAACMAAPSGSSTPSAAAAPSAAPRVACAAPEATAPAAACAQEPA